MSIAIGTRVRSQSIPAREGVVIDGPGNHPPAPIGFAWVQWEASPDDEQRWDYLAHIEAEGDLIHDDHDTFKQGDLLQHNDLGPVTFLRWGSSDAFRVIVVQHQGQEHKVFVSDLISEWVTNPEVERLINTATVFDPVDDWPTTPTFPPVSDATIAEVRALARADRERDFFDSLPETIEVSTEAVWRAVQNGNAPYEFILALDQEVPGWRDAKRFIEDV